MALLCLWWEFFLKKENLPLPWILPYIRWHAVLCLLIMSPPPPGPHPTMNHDTFKAPIGNRVSQVTDHRSGHTHKRRHLRKYSLIFSAWFSLHFVQMSCTAIVLMFQSACFSPILYVVSVVPATYLSAFPGVDPFQARHTDGCSINLIVIKTLFYMRWNKK